MVANLRAWLHDRPRLHRTWSVARGGLDYIFNRSLHTPWRAGFNNQSARQAIFTELITHVTFSGIVETGTFLGTTTEFMHRQSLLPVTTVESYPRYFGFAWIRLFRYPRIHLHLGDSRPFLRTLCGQSNQQGKTVFYYLDAHWGEDLPLNEELEIIFHLAPKAVVMIDDFKVPDDNGYQFDDYGADRVLNLEYLSKGQTAWLGVFFPSTLSSRETGAKRGCVVLAQDDTMIRLLRSTQSLREWKNR